MGAEQGASRSVKGKAKRDLERVTHLYGLLPGPLTRPSPPVTLSISLSPTVCAWHDARCLGLYSEWTNRQACTMKGRSKRLTCGEEGGGANKMAGRE